MTELFGLSIIICLAAIIGVTAKIFKQPLILAYIATGLIVAITEKKFGLLNLDSQTSFNLFSELGIVFLLFLIGLQMNYSSLKTVGKTSLVIGLGQVSFTFIFGFIIATIIGFSSVHAAYLAIALTFSSTIIIIKLLSDKKSLDSLYGKISVGLLLVQDFIVILLLIGLAGIGAGDGFVLEKIVFTFISGIILFGATLFLGRNFFPKIFTKFAKSQELLFLVSIAWVFALIVFVELFRKWTGISFSIEIAGFLAGVALSNSSESFQIANRIKPLRDFFILIFFVVLGSSIALYSFASLVLPIIVLSVFVLIGNPLIVMILMGRFMGYRKRTSFMTGITVAQISEFSLILMALGLSLGHVSEEIVAITAGVAIITISLSTYMVTYSEKIYSKISCYLSIFEKDKKRNELLIGFKEKPIILIGYDRTGKSLASKISPDKMTIIDFNPEIIKKLIGRGHSCVYGDILDPMIFETVLFNKAKLVISTSPNLTDNINLLAGIKIHAKKTKTIIRAKSGKDAEILYEMGADYVFVPLYASGQYLGEIINSDPDLKSLRKLKKKELDFIKKINKE